MRGHRMHAAVPLRGRYGPHAVSRLDRLPAPAFSWPARGAGGGRPSVAASSGGTSVLTHARHWPHIPPRCRGGHAAGPWGVCGRLAVLSAHGQPSTNASTFQVRKYHPLNPDQVPWCVAWPKQAPSHMPSPGVTHRPAPCPFGLRAGSVRIAWSFPFADEGAMQHTKSPARAIVHQCFSCRATGPSVKSCSWFLSSPGGSTLSAPMCQSCWSSLIPRRRRHWRMRRPL